MTRRFRRRRPRRLGTTAGEWLYTPDERFLFGRARYSEIKGRWVILTAAPDEAFDWLLSVKLTSQFASFPTREAAAQALELAIATNPLPAVAA